MRLLTCLFISTTLFAAGDPVKGKDVFIPCSYCHDVETGVRKRGPSLKNLFLREKLVNGESLTEDNLRALIRDGYNGMPSYGVLINRAQFDDLVAFLARYTDFPGSDPGKNTFVRSCSGCHNEAEFQGLFKREKLANGKPVNDANVAAQIDEGGERMPAFKESLDDAAKKALLAYLKTL